MLTRGSFDPQAKAAQTYSANSLWAIRLFGAVALGLLVPTLATHLFAEEVDFDILRAALGWNLFAIAGTVWTIQKLLIFPRTSAVGYFPLAVTAWYGLVTVVLFATRADYSIVVMGVGFFTTLAWFYSAHVVWGERTVARIGVVPVGEWEPVSHLALIDSVALRLDEPTPDGLTAIVADLRVDLSDEWDRYIADRVLDGLPVFHSKTLVESLTGRVEIEHLSENAFGTLAPINIYVEIKHWIDRLVALAAIVPLFPLFAGVSAWIAYDSRGPVLFRQQRMGYRGKPFTIYKFRTMRQPVVAEGSTLEDAITQSDDARITTSGAILRKLRIDELPQLLNIVKGEMSWIGPRPEAMILSRWYESEISFYRYRHVVRPGITGWAQVNQGHVAQIDDVAEKLHFDFFYIKHFSPWLDLLITAKTIKVMLTGFGAK